jgi:hypothetical protein
MVDCALSRYARITASAAETPGHDAWVVGNEPVVVIDLSGMQLYSHQAKKEGPSQSSI